MLRFGSGMVRFGSTNFWSNAPVMLKQATLYKISDRIWFGSGPFLGEHISDVGSDMDPGRSVRISGQFCQV